MDLTAAHILQLCDSGVKGSVQCSPVGGCAGSPDGNCWVRAVWAREVGGYYYFFDLVNGAFNGVYTDPPGRAFSVRCLLLALDGYSGKATFHPRLRCAACSSRLTGTHSCSLQACFRPQLRCAACSSRICMYLAGTA